VTDTPRWRPVTALGGSVTTPTLLAVHDQPTALDVIRRELTGRYATDYEIICEQSPESASDEATRWRSWSR